MSIRKSLIVAGTSLLLAGTALAQSAIEISDPYARTSQPGAPTGAAFMILKNTGSEDDRLISASSDIATRVELHTHIDMGDGVMKMTEVEGGFPIPAGAEHPLMRGGDHVMFMGLNQPLEQGQTVTVTLTFEKAGDIVLDIPVDLTRKPAHGGMQHGMKHKKSGG